MIILSNALPKTGSTYIVSLQEDLLKVSGIASGQEALRNTFGGRYLSWPTPRVILRLLALNALHGSVVVKCHWPAMHRLRVLKRLNVAKITLSYRDPRDMILSMIDHGKRSRAGKDPRNAFVRCENVLQVIPFVDRKVAELMRWRQVPGVHFICYETLMADPDAVISDMLNHLRWPLSAEQRSQVLAEQERVRSTSWNYNTGAVERWRREMTPEEREQTTRHFSESLKILGYQLS